MRRFEGYMQMLAAGRPTRARWHLVRKVPARRAPSAAFHRGSTAYGQPPPRSSESPVRRVRPRREPARPGAAPLEGRSERARAPCS